MKEARNGRLPVGLWLLLAYQGLVLLISLYFTAIYGYVLMGGLPSSASGEYPVIVLFILVLAGWDMALAYASVGVGRRRSGGILVGMACHLLISIPALILLVVFGLLGGLRTYLFLRGEDQAWAEIGVIVGLMCLPFALGSGWGFFYLRRFYKREWPDNSAEPSTAADSNSQIPPDR